MFFVPAGGARMRIMEANMERDRREWLTVRDPDTGEVFFHCAHCGNGDYGWEFWASSSVNQFHATNFEELFNAVSWVVRDHINHYEVVGYFEPEFTAWWRR